MVGSLDDASMRWVAVSERSFSIVSSGSSSSCSIIGVAESCLRGAEVEVLLLLVSLLTSSMTRVGEDDGSSGSGGCCCKLLILPMIVPVSVMSGRALSTGTGARAVVDVGDVIVIMIYDDVVNANENNNGAVSVLA